MVNVLEKKWFHAKDSFGESLLNILWQGQILSEILPGYYLVQLFSWEDGEPTVQKVITLESMKHWSFFDSCEAMKTRYKLLARG